MKTENISLSANDRLNLVSNLSTMLNAGLTISEAVGSLLTDAAGPLRIILSGIQEDILQGQTLSISLQKYPRVFDRVTIAIVKASEESGTLDVVLKDIKETLKKDIEFSDKIKAALTYPCIIMVVFFGVLALLLTFVIPKIAEVFTKLKVTLPLPTRILITASDLIVHSTIPTLLVCGAVIAFFIVVYKKQKSLISNLFLSLPYVSTLARQIDLAQFCRSMFLLLTSAIPISSALELSENIANSSDIKKAILRSKEYVLSGKKLSEGFSRQKGIPSLMVKIIEVGERSGTLPKSMADLEEYFDYQVTTSLRYLVALLEPGILIIVGVVVGGMMMAIIAPIYSLIGQVGAVR